MWKTLDEKTLKSKKVVELREIAKTFGLQGYEKMKKADLIANLMREDPKEENSNSVCCPAPRVRAVGATGKARTARRCRRS